MKKIIITGGTGRFGKILKDFKTKHKLFFPTRKDLDILDVKKINQYLEKRKPDILIHLAGLSRPMKLHETDIEKSIDLNIIGTANITKACSKKKIKLVYFSTNYVYPGSRGNYKESDSVFPVNNYAWSKLGGEASVQLYKNSLILRVSMTEKPFIHSKAFSNVKTNFIYHDQFAKIFIKVLHCKGVLNIGGKTQTIYDFAKKNKKNILKKKSKGQLPLNISMSLKKLNNLMKL